MNVITLRSILVAVTPLVTLAESATLLRNIISAPQALLL